MSIRLQLDVRNLSLGIRHLVNAYEVKADIGVITGNMNINSVCISDVRKCKLPCILLFSQFVAQNAT